ncbi:mCG145073, partial [Mus musculus]
ENGDKRRNSILEFVWITAIKQGKGKATAAFSSEEDKADSPSGRRSCLIPQGTSAHCCTVHVICCGCRTIQSVGVTVQSRGLADTNRPER